MGDSSTKPSEDVRQRIRDAGLRATAGRIAVYEVMVGAEGPLTHNDVVDILGPRGFDRASIYRNLVDLTTAGLATRRDLGDHVWRFELAREGGDHFSDHPHFVCTECGDVVCLPEDEVVVRVSAG